MKSFPLIIGVMSGTSLDGLDVAACAFSIGNDGKFSFEIHHSHTFSYSAAIKQKLHNAPKLSGAELTLLNNEFGSFIAQKVNEFAENHNIKAALISSHGHTVFHQPHQKMTLQIGHGATIYAGTKTAVVCDFRSVDVAMGGQGAPLVPVGDQLLFPEYDFCLNLGGIANISFQRQEQRMAFDICACNLLLNHLAAEKGLAYDEGGKLARAGKVQPLLMEAFESWPYYNLPIPKSLDKDSLLRDLLPLLNGFYFPVEDKLASVCAHIALKIQQAVKQNLQETHRKSVKVLVTGGGAFNTYLLELLNQNDFCHFEVPDKQTVEFKEALVFAFLGLLRMLNISNALSASTGAVADNLGGALYGPYDAALWQIPT